MTSNATSTPRISWIGLGLVFLTPALGGFLYGYDIGATAFVLAMLQDGGNHDNSSSAAAPQVWWHNFGSDNQDSNNEETSTTIFTMMSGAQQKGLFIASMSLGALLGSHLVLFHGGAPFLGRRLELRLAAVLYLLGSLFQMASGTSYLAHSHTWGWPALLTGRTLLGMGIGWVMHAAPQYMAEMAPPTIRGAIVSAKETIIVLGIVFGYAVGDFVSSSSTTMSESRYNNGNDESFLPNQWTVLYQVSFLLSLPMLVLTFWVPRSVRWLLTQEQTLRYHGNDDRYVDEIKANALRQEAKESLQFLYVDDVTDELNQLSQQVATNHLVQLQRQQQQHVSGHQHHGGDGGAAGCGTTWTALLGDPTCRQPLGVALGIILLMESSGQPALLSYSTMLFEQAGWSGHASVVNATIMLCFSTLTIFWVDMLGRKRLLQLCAALMGASLVILSIQAPYVWGNDTATASAPRSVMLEEVAMTESSSEGIFVVVDDDEFDRHVVEPAIQEEMTVTTAAAWQRTLVLLAMFLYIGSYQLGFGPITWVVVSEVFPSHVRGQATALAVEVKYILQFGVQFAVPVLQETLGWRITFGGFAACMAFAALYFIPTFVSETTGMTLEQIEAKTRQRCYAKTKLSTLSTLVMDSDDDDDDETSANTSANTPTNDDDFAPSEQTSLLRSNNSDCNEMHPLDLAL